MTRLDTRIVFPAPGRVELQHRELPAPGDGQVCVRSIVSLVSTGTEPESIDPAECRETYDLIRARRTDTLGVAFDWG